MIVRISYRIAPSVDAADYEAHLRAEEIPARRRAAGNLGTHLLRRGETGRSHFVLLTLWDSAESVRRFLAEEAARAHEGPRAGADLAEAEPFVEDFELVTGGGEAGEGDAPELTAALAEACAGWDSGRFRPRSTVCPGRR